MVWVQLGKSKVGGGEGSLQLGKPDFLPHGGPFVAVPNQLQVILYIGTSIASSVFGLNIKKVLKDIDCDSQCAVLRVAPGASLHSFAGEVLAGPREGNSPSSPWVSLVLKPA
jgi:hypothetical protein